MKIFSWTANNGSFFIFVDIFHCAFKYDLSINCYDDIDELNSTLGLLVTSVSPLHQGVLQDIQRKLFQVGFAISASSTLTEEDVNTLENLIDSFTRKMPPNTSFVLPGGCTAAAQAHVCRAVCRRAERSVISLSKNHEVSDVVQAYLNRLSDFLFTFARYLNVEAGVVEVPV